MSCYPKKSQRGRWSATNPKVDKYLIDDLHFQNDVDRTKGMKHPASSRGFKIFHPSTKSPVRKNRGGKCGSGPRYTRCSSNFRPGAEKTPSVQSDVKSGRVHSRSTPVDTSKVSACQSLNEEPEMQESHVGEATSSAFEHPQHPGGELSFISSLDQTWDETSKEKPLAQKITQGGKWCFIDQCSFKIEEVDSIFQGEETLDNLRQRLAICKEAIEYFLWASYSSDGPPCFKAKMAAMDNYLSFRDFCQSIVRSRVFSGSDPATNEPSSVGKEHHPETKNASDFQEVNTNKSENTTPIDLRDTLKDKGEGEHQHLCITNDYSEIEEDQSSFHGISLVANTEKVQCTDRDSNDKEPLNDTSEPLENISLHRVSSSVKSGQRSGILSPTSMSEDAYFSFQKDYNDDEEWSGQMKMNDPAWRYPPHSQNEAFREPSMRCNNNGRSYAAKRGAVNQMASPFYHRSSLDRPHFSARQTSQANENRYLGSTERYDYPKRSYRDDNNSDYPNRPYRDDNNNDYTNRSYRDDNNSDYPKRPYRDNNRFYGENYGSQRYDDNYWSGRDSQEHSRSNYNLPRDYKDNSPRRYSRSPKRHTSFGWSSMSLYCETRDDPPLYTPQGRNYPRPDSIKVQQIFGLGLSESRVRQATHLSESRVSQATHISEFRVSQATRLSDNNSYKDWTAQRYAGANTPEANGAPQARPLRNNQQHTNFRKNCVGSVDTSDRSLTFKRGEGHFEGQYRSDRLEVVAVETNCHSLDAPSNTNSDFKPVDIGFPESTRKGSLDQSKPHLSEEKELNTCQNSYQRPQPIEFVDDGQSLKPPTQHAIKTEVTESQASRGSSVSIYTKIPSSVLALCVPGDPRRQYLVVGDGSNGDPRRQYLVICDGLNGDPRRQNLVVGDGSNKEWDWSERRAPLLKKLKKENEYNDNKAHKNSFNRFKSHQLSGYIKKERYCDEPIVFRKKNISPRKKIVSERKESTNMKQMKNSELTKAQIVHLLDDICTVPEPILPLPEDETIVEKSRASPNLILNQTSTLADECSTQCDASSTGCQVSSILGDVGRTKCDNRSTECHISNGGVSTQCDACSVGCHVSSMLSDASRTDCDARSTECDISNKMADVSRTECDTSSTGCHVSSTLGYEYSKGFEDDHTGFDIDIALADAFCTGWDVSNMLGDYHITECDASNSGFDILSKFGDACGTGHDTNRMGIGAFSLEGNMCTLQERTMSESDVNGIEPTSKSCSNVIESKMSQLITLETPKSLRQLCLSILSDYPCPQTDTLPYLDNVISLSDQLIARDFLRAHKGPQYYRSKYNKRTFRESFALDDYSQFAICPRGNTPPGDEYLTTRPIRRHKRLKYDDNSNFNNSNFNNSNFNNSNFNNSNQSGDERDAEDGRQTNRTPENCDRFILDDMSTPIVLSAADRVYHVSSRGQGWSSETYPCEANITHEDTTRVIDYLNDLVSPETTSGLSNDDFTQADGYVPSVLDFGQESDLLEADGPVINSRDMLEQAMSSAGLADFLVDGYIRCDKLIEPLLFEDPFEPDEAGLKPLPNFQDNDYQCRVCDVDKAWLKGDNLDFLDVAIEGATDTNDAFENSSKEKWSHQEVYDQIGYNHGYHGYSNCCTNKEYSIFDNEKLDYASPNSPAILLGPLESVNKAPRILGHGKLDELFPTPGYCYQPSQYSTAQASKLLTSVEMIFPGFIPGFGSTSPPYCEDLCGITQDSQQLTEALCFLSDEESCDSNGDIQASSNITTTDDERTLHQSQDVDNGEMMTRKRKMLISDTSSESIDETTNTTEGSKSEQTQHQLDSEKFVRAVAAYTSYDVGKVPGGQSPRGENRKDSHNKGGPFIARTLDFVKRYGPRNRQLNKKSSKKEFQDRGLKVKVKTPKLKRTKVKTSRISLDEICIVDWDKFKVQNASLDVNHLKTNVRTTKRTQRATDTPCMDDGTMQETTDDTLQEILTQEKVNQDLGETRDGSRVGCDAPGTNAGPKDDNDVDGVVKCVSPGTLTKYFDKQQESMELFTRQMSKLSPGFLKNQEKGPPPQIQPKANRVATKIVYCMKCNRSKTVNAGMKAVDETCQHPPGDALDYNNNASWDNIGPGNSKMKVAKTDKGKDPKKVPSNESRLHLPRVFDKGSNLEKDKKKQEKISGKFRKQYQSIHQAPSTLSLLPMSGVAHAGNVNRSHVSSTEMGQLPEIGQGRSGNENQNKSPMYGTCTLPFMKASVQENSKVINFVKRLDSRYGDQLARGDVDTSRRLKKCCKSYLNKHTCSNISVVSSMDKKKSSPITCTPCTTSDKIEADINFLAAHNSNLLDSSEGVNPSTKETQPAETVDSLPPEATKPPKKPGNDGNASCSGQGSTKNTNASSAKKLGEATVKPSAKKAPPLRSDIASSVSRLTAKPPSPTTRLMYKIQSYEQEFKKPFNINECSKDNLAKAAPKFSREKYTRDIQKFLPLYGGSGENMTHASVANKPKLPLGSASKDSLQGGHASKIATKALGGLPKRFEDFPDGAIKVDQLETRQSIMASLPSELTLGEDKVQKKSLLVVDSVKTPSKISPSKSVVVNERESDGTNLEIKSLAQLRQVSERSFSLEFPDVFDQHQILSPLSNSMTATVGTITMHRLSAEVSSVKGDSALTSSQEDVKQIPTSVSSSTSSVQKEFYSVALPAGISEELLKELEANPEPKSGCEEVKSLEEELEEFLNECGVDEKDYNDYDNQEFDGIDVDEEELRLLKNGSGRDQPVNRSGSDQLDNRSGSDQLENRSGSDQLENRSGSDQLENRSGSDQLENRSGSDQLENRSGSDQLENRSGSDQLENRSGSDQLENGSRDDKPSGTKIISESDSLTSPLNCSQSNETQPGCEKATIDAKGFESLGGVCEDPGLGDDSSCDIFKVESLTSIKKSLDYAFDDQFNDVYETCVEGKKEVDDFWGDATDYWTNPSSYLPGPRSFKKLTPIQEDLEEDEGGSITSNEP